MPKRKVAKVRQHVRPSKNRTGKKRNQKMLASEERRKQKEEWEKYNTNWNGDGALDNLNPNEVLGSDESEPEEILPTDMIDAEYTTDNMGFIRNVTLEAESKPRKFKNEEETDKHESMAIRDEDGNIIKKMKLIPEKKPVKAEIKTETEVKEEVVSDVESSDEEAPKTAIEVIQYHEKKMQILKVKLAETSNTIISAPENLAHLKLLKKLISSIKDRLKSKKHLDFSISSIKFIILTVTEIFVNILPSYRIRDRSEDEAPKVKISKDVKKQWDEEEALLTAYQEFLAILETEILAKNRNDLKQVVCRAFCVLFVKATEFNYHNNITVVMVSLLKKKTVNNFVLTEVTKSLKEVFTSDNYGEPSKNAVVALAALFREEKFQLPTAVLETFLSLNIHEIKTPEKFISKKKQKSLIFKEKRDSKKKREKFQKNRSKADVKKSKEQEKLDKDLMEIQATHSKEKTLEFHTRIIEEIFSIYFTILKSKKGNLAKRKLYRATLIGLRNFAHLINIDFFADLFSNFCANLKDESLSSIDKLNLVKTGCVLLSGQGESLNIDFHSLYEFLRKNQNKFLEKKVIFL